MKAKAMVNHQWGRHDASTEEVFLPINQLLAFFRSLNDKFGEKSDSGDLFHKVMPKFIYKIVENKPRTDNKYEGGIPRFYTRINYIIRFSTERDKRYSQI